MEGKIKSISVQPDEKLEIEYRTKIDHKEFHFLKSKLSLEKTPEYRYDLYKIYNSDSTYRFFDNGEKQLKTAIMKFPISSFSIKYNLSVSIEKFLEDKYQNNTIFIQKRIIERYHYNPDNFKVSLSKVITSSKKKKYISYEVEAECTKENISTGEKIFLSFLLFAKFPFNMPVSPGKNMIKKIIYNYHSSFKADGERVSLIISPKGIWHYNRKIKITPLLENPSEEFFKGREIIIDCELLNGIYYLFDLPYLTENSYKDRKEKLSEIFSKISQIVPSGIKDSEKDITSDGLIFTPQGKYSETIYKIKQVPTIEINYPLSDKIKGYLDSKEIFPSFPLSDDKESIYEIDLQGRVIKTRDDKSSSNPLGLIKKIVNDDSWEKYQKIIENNGCHMMRYHHNIIKEKVLDVINGELLDIGDGTGEDMKKWSIRRNIKEVFAVDDNNEVRRKISMYNNKKIKIVDLEFNGEFHKKYNNKQKNMTMFFCLSQVIRKFSGVDGLSETIKNIGIKNLYVINMFEEDISYKKCSRWSISSDGDDRVITINDTKKVNIREKKIYFKDLEKSMKKQGYDLGKKYNLPNPNIDCLSQEERELNKFYSYVYFTKRK